MINIRASFRRFFREIRSQLTPTPFPRSRLPQTGYDYPPPDEINRAFADARLQSRGVTRGRFFRLVSSIRVSRYIGRQASNVFVNRGQYLSFEGLWYHPEYGHVELYGSLPTGVNYNYHDFRTYAVRSLLEQDPRLQNVYDLMEIGIFEVNFFLNNWVRATFA